MVILRKTIIVLLLAGFATWVLADVWIHVSYSTNLPSVPDEKAGRIHRMLVNHGYVRYGSERELQALSAVENALPVAITLFLIAAILGLKFGDFHIRGDP